ncbi:MAG: hypothetical protein PHO18_05345 [Synergistaceae bacterium]|nr:hypothetical protein [Synergistaceae bacterium]
MRLLLIVALVLSSLMIPASSWSSDDVEFSALIIEKDNGEEQRGKIFIAKNMSRYELEGSGEIIVTRHDKKVIWLIFPKLRKYVEQPYLGEPKQNYAGANEINTGDLSKKFIEHERVDSYRLKKFLVTVKYNNGESKDQYYEWYRDNFPVPVKTESMDGRTSYEYLNIKLGRPPAELFSKPKGYKKITADELAETEKSPNQQQ